MKRWTETNKWKDKWFMSLTPIQKLIWGYLIDNCDNAGFFEINSRVDSFLIGISEQEYLGAYEGLMRGLIYSHDKAKIWLKKFLFHQKNIPLNPANNAHKQIIGIVIENIKHFDYNFSNLGAYEGLISPLGKGNNKGKGKEERGEGENISVVFTLDDLRKYLNESPTKVEQICRAFKIDMNSLVKYFEEFIKKTDLKDKVYPNRSAALSHFINWLSKQLNTNKPKTLTEQWMS